MTPKLLLALGAATALAAALSGGGLFLFNAGKRACEAKVAIEAAIEVKRQAREANEALEAARQKAEKRALEVAALEDQVDAYVQELRNRGDSGGCILDDADAERLLNIR